MSSCTVIAIPLVTFTIGGIIIIIIIIIIVVVVVIIIIIIMQGRGKSCTNTRSSLNSFRLWWENRLCDEFGLFFPGNSVNQGGEHL